MRRLIALALVVALVVVLAVPAAEAGGAATNIFGLASFAVFNSLFVAPFFYPRYAYAAPAPAYYYPAYRRIVWIPNPPAPPAAPPAPPTQ